MEQLQIKTSMQILKPVEEVFEAIVDPEKMSNYFIAQSTGRMESGKTLEWKFPEFEEVAPVKVREVRKPHYLSYTWEGSKGKDLLVEFTLSERPGNHTLLTITEGTMDMDKSGLAWYGGNTAGWANFLACLKAYVEYGINLRKGAFDYMKDSNTL